jgi:hypothetical protein
MMKVPNDYYDKWNICDTDKILIYGCNKHIGSVMVNVLDPRAVDGGFGPRSDQTKRFSTRVTRGAGTSHPSGAPEFTPDFEWSSCSWIFSCPCGVLVGFEWHFYLRTVISESTLWRSSTACWLSTTRVSSSSTSSYNQNVACSRQDIADKLHMYMYCIWKHSHLTFHFLYFNLSLIYIYIYI